MSAIGPWNFCARLRLGTAAFLIVSTAVAIPVGEQGGPIPPASAAASASQAQPPASATPPVPGTASDNEARAVEAQQPLPTDFQSHGMEYETLTKNGITVMFAPLPPHIKEYNIIQVTVTNGSLVSWTVKPSDFTYIRQNGTVLLPSSADSVVSSLMERASANDVIKLQLLYEDTIYGLANFRATNGYEQRREAGMTQFVNLRFKAAAAASAITLVPAKLKPGDSTDGAVFFENKSKEKVLGAGRLLVKTCGETFVFQVFGEMKVH